MIVQHGCSPLRENIETSQLSRGVDVILQTYDSFRTGSNLAGMEGLRDSIADSARQNMEKPGIVAITMVELLLDGHDPQAAPNLANLIAETSEEDIREHLATAYPSANDLLIFAVSPDENALPNACVITRIEQVLDC